MARPSDQTSASKSSVAIRSLILTRHSSRPWVRAVISDSIGLRRSFLVIKGDGGMVHKGLGPRGPSKNGLAPPDFNRRDGPTQEPGVPGTSSAKTGLDRSQGEKYWLRLPRDDRGLAAGASVAAVRGRRLPFARGARTRFGEPTEPTSRGRTLSTGI